MVGDVLGMGRSSVLEGFMGGSVDPEIEAITLESVSEIPDLVDPASYAMQLAYACEMNLTSMNLDILAEEYVYLRENGTEMVYESVNLSNIVKRFKEWVKKLWEKITSFFKTLFVKIGAQTTSVKKMLEVYKDAGAKSDSVTVSTIVPAKTTPSTIGKEAQTIISNIRSEIDELYDDIRGIGKNTGTYSEDELKKKSTSDDIKKVAKRVINKDECTQKSVAAAIGVEDKDKISMTGTAAYASLKQYVAAEGEFKAIYAVNKGVIDGMIKASKELERMVGTQSKMSGTSESDTKNAQGRDRFIHYNITIMTKVGSWMNIVNSATVAAMNACLSRDKFVLAKIKSGKSGSTNESFVML